MSARDLASDEAQVEASIASIRHSPLASVVTDPRLPDNPIVAVNQAFCDLTGYAANEAVGRNCRFLSGPLTEEAEKQIIRDAVAKGLPALVELLNYREDGTPFRNAVMIAPVRSATGEVLLFVGSQLLVGGASAETARRREMAAAKKTASLSPRQREVLRLMIHGQRSKQIAAQIGIAEKTVKHHRSQLLGALGVRTSTEAVRIGVEAGMAGED